MYRTSHLEDQPSSLERVLKRVEEFLRTRTADHWLMFIAGLVIGLVVG